MLLMEEKNVFLVEKVQNPCCLQRFRYFFFWALPKRLTGYVFGNARKSIPTSRKISTNVVVVEIGPLFHSS